MVSPAEPILLDRRVQVVTRLKRRFEMWGSQVVSTSRSGGALDLVLKEKVRVYCYEVYWNAFLEQLSNWFDNGPVSNSAGVFCQ